MYSLTYGDHRTLTIEMIPYSRNSFMTVFDLIDSFSKFVIAYSYQDFRSKFIQSGLLDYSFEQSCLLSALAEKYKQYIEPKTETMLLSKPAFDKFCKIYPEYFVDSNKYIAPDIKTTYNNLSLTYFPSIKTSNEELFEIIYKLLFQNKQAILSNP